MTTGSNNEKRGRGRPKKWKPREPIAPDTELPQDSSPSSAPPPVQDNNGAQDGGFEEALRGAGEDVPPNGPNPEEKTSSGIPPTPPKTAPKPVDPAEVEALLNFCDMTTIIVCRGFAISRKVTWTADLQKNCMLSAGEKKQLEMVAPAAIPYVRILMQHMDKVAAGIFFLSYSFMLAGRLSTIKAKANEEAEKRGEKPKEGPVEKAANDTIQAFMPDHK